MNVESIIDRLEHTAEALRVLLAPVGNDDARWRPPSGDWTILETVNHLADGETLDFRTRIRSTLEDPTRPWPPLDPEGDIEHKRYNERDLAESLTRFARERAETVKWLRSLETPSWSNTYDHPRTGPLRAGDLLASLATHDALHLRELALRLLDLVHRDAEEFDPAYAGE